MPVCRGTGRQTGGREGTHVWHPVGRERMHCQQGSTPPTWRNTALSNCCQQPNPSERTEKQHTAAAHLRQHGVLQNHAHAVAAQHAPPHAAAAQPAAAAHPRLLVLLHARGWEGSPTQSETCRQRRLSRIHTAEQPPKQAPRFSNMHPTCIPDTMPNPGLHPSACLLEVIHGCLQHTPSGHTHHLSHSHPHTWKSSMAACRLSTSAWDAPQGRLRCRASCPGAKWREVTGGSPWLGAAIAASWSAARVKCRRRAVRWLRGARSARPHPLPTSWS